MRTNITQAIVILALAAGLFFGTIEAWHLALNEPMAGASQVMSTSGVSHTHHGHCRVWRGHCVACPDGCWS